VLRYICNEKKGGEINMIHTYRQRMNGTGYNVGYYMPNDEWYTSAGFRKEIQAIAFTNYLNGGNQDISIIADLLKKKL
jgi:hypothetical protein